MAIGSGRVGQLNDFIVDHKRPDIESLLVGIIGPSNPEVKQLIINNDGTLKVTYFPKTVGEYYIQVTHFGIDVSGSPYKIRVTAEERTISSIATNMIEDESQLTYEPSDLDDGMRVYGPGLYLGIVNGDNEIIINSKNARQHGFIEYSMQGPGDIDLKRSRFEKDVYRFFYNPEKPGDHFLKIRYANKEVYGSPFKIPVEEKIFPCYHYK